MGKMKILVPGAGPIIIGQAAEFDYSGTQCCSALREDGHKVILVNSNPATIQTDPDTADIVYIEPLTVESLAKIIEKTILNYPIEFLDKALINVEKYGNRITEMKKMESLYESI